MHKLDYCAHGLVIPNSLPLHPYLEGLSHKPYLILINAEPTAYVDIFVDEFMDLAQGAAHKRHYFWCTSFQELDKVF